MNGRGALVCCVALSVSGCVQNAVLEIEVELPERPVGEGAACVLPADCDVAAGLACVEGSCAPRAFVQIQPRDAADNPFEDDWVGGDLETVELLAGERIIDMVSVVTTNVDADVNVKVRFCTTRTCSALEDAMAPERRFQLQHPFYVGERTLWVADIPDVPASFDSVPTVIDRCDIRGCVGGGDLTDYCRLDGRHVCE